MTTCNECEYHTPPAVLDAGHPCFSCKGDRVVIDGSNFKAKQPPTRPTWTEYFLQIAALAATRSKDRSTKVGAVIVDGSRAIVSTGYNGFPAGMDDEVESRHERPTKYLYTCHAEENAILSAARRGASVDGCTLYCTHQPCSRCARGIVQAGIKNVVFPAGSVIPTMVDDLAVGIDILVEAGISITSVEIPRPEPPTEPSKTCKTCVHFSREPSDQDGLEPWYSTCNNISIESDDAFPQDGSGFCWMHKSRSGPRSFETTEPSVFEDGK